MEQLVHHMFCHRETRRRTKEVKQRVESALQQTTNTTHTCACIHSSSSPSQSPRTGYQLVDCRGPTHLRWQSWLLLGVATPRVKGRDCCSTQGSDENEQERHRAFFGGKGMTVTELSGVLPTVLPNRTESRNQPRSTTILAQAARAYSLLLRTTCESCSQRHGLQNQQGSSSSF